MVECFVTGAALWTLVCPFEPAAVLAFLSALLRVIQARTDDRQAGTGTFPFLVAPEPTDGDWKTCEMERRKNCFPGCKAEMCRN